MDYVKIEEIWKDLNRREKWLTNKFGEYQKLAPEDSIWKKYEM